MMLPFSLFLALKYLRPKRTFLSVVTVLSVLGVLLGVAVLIIVLSVMTGFDEMWRNKILDFNAHLTVSVRGDLDGEEDDLCAAIEAVPGVKGAAPFLQSLVFIQKPNGQVETPLIRGVDPEREARVSRIPQSIVEGGFSVANGDVVIGRDLAHRLNVGVGDSLTVMPFGNTLELKLVTPRILYAAMENSVSKIAGQDAATGQVTAGDGRFLRPAA